MKTVFYWSPCLNKVGTLKSTINSALALSKYSKDEYKIKVINACGEWNEQRNLFEKNNIEILDFNFTYFKYLPKKGFLASRLSYIVIILLSIVPLYKILKNEKSHKIRAESRGPILSI